MRSRSVAVILIGVEGVACFAAGVGFVIAALVGHPSDRGVAVVLGALLAFYGVLVLLVARGFWRGRSWARTPAFLVQFFALVVAWYQRSTLPLIAAVVALVAITAGASLVASERRTPDPD
ncbi:MAG: hypothetical protein JO222_01060 [Frankiales bacterium]|nr:hypothetical protein [Frankiales bacterium]